MGKKGFIIYGLIILIGCTVPQMALPEKRDLGQAVQVHKIDPFVVHDPIIRFVRSPGKDTIINKETINHIDTAALNHWFNGLEEKIEANHGYRDYERVRLEEVIAEYKNVIVENGILLAHFVEATAEKEQAQKKAERVYSIFADTPFIFLVVYMLIFHFPIWVKIRLLRQQIALLKDNRKYDR